MLGGQVFEDEAFPTVLDAEGKWRIGVSRVSFYAARR
jgi:hypothetical protein